MILPLLRVYIQYNLSPVDKVSESACVSTYECVYVRVSSNMSLLVDFYETVHLSSNNYRALKQNMK